MFWLRRHGRRWHVGIPRLGTVGAARILRWLDAHEDSLGPLPEALCRGLLGADTPPPVPSALPSRFGIVPLERLQLPPALSSAAVSTGVQSGSQRTPSAGCRIAATDDVQAIRAWLSARARAAHTARAYRKEAERLLLWSTVLRGKPMSSLDTQDCAAYRAFLAAPPAAWCGPRHSSRQSADWRPFEGPLSPRSAATAVAGRWATRGCGCASRRRR